MMTLDDALLRDAVTVAVAQAMEAMFFDAAEPAPECECAAAECITAAVRFCDSMQGEFLLSVPVETALALASSFMALDTDAVDRSRVEQTICELANIICGSALSRLEPSSDLRLSSPQILEGPLTPEVGAVSQHYRLLDGCMSVAVRVAN